MLKKYFITGMSCSGKTTYAKKLAEETSIPFINFDSHFDYNKSKNYDYVKKVYTDLPDKFIIDAVPFNLGWNVFIEYIQEHDDIELIYNVCSNPITWCFRFMNKFGFAENPSVETIKKTFHSGFTQYYGLYYNTISAITGLVKYKIFDSFDNTYITTEELYKRIDWVKAIKEETQ